MQGIDCWLSDLMDEVLTLEGFHDIDADAEAKKAVASM